MNVTNTCALLPRFPTYPVPEPVKAGPYLVTSMGTRPTVRATGSTLTVQFTGKAVAGGDMAAFVSVKVPANAPRPGADRQPSVVTIGLRNGESALDQAKDLEAACKKTGLRGYIVSRRGSTVKLQQTFMCRPPR